MTKTPTIIIGRSQLERERRDILIEVKKVVLCSECGLPTDTHDPKCSRRPRGGCPECHQQIIKADQAEIGHDFECPLRPCSNPKCGLPRRDHVWGDAEGGERLLHCPYMLRASLVLGSIG